ncbi:MAG: type II/IV secretion system ATPase subunit [Candidatus Micrarchaeota archaeon]|nr:type II/IV secretion system ATPase subunit [Candidatus Micrarchaeota archaeon]
MIFMVNIQFWKPRQKPQIQMQREKLSFTVEFTPYSSKLEEANLQIRRDLVKIGGLTRYLFCADFGEIRKTELELLEMAKFSVIQELSKRELKGIEDFGAAKNTAINELSRYIPLDRAAKLALLVAYDTVGYGPISLLVEDRSNIEEIEIDSPTGLISIYHTRYGRCTTNLRFNSEEHFRRTINRFIYDSDKELNESTPIIDAQIGDSRLHAQIKPYAISGACATIRLNGRKEANISHLLGNETANFDELAYLWMAIESRANIIISGAPASGKTTLLISLLSFVPRYLRAITIEEDVNELKFYSNVSSIVSLYGSRQKNYISTKEQVINALRMRPDLLIVGEMRGDEAKELFAGANLGIPFFTTMHSNDSEMSLIKRLLVRPMGVDPQAISSLDISIQMRNKGVDRRAIGEITEYKWLSRAEILEGGMLVGDDMVKMDSIALNSAINPNLLKESKVVAAYSANNGITKPLAIKELKKRAEFLKDICLASKSTLELIEGLYRYNVGK